MDAKKITREAIATRQPPTAYRLAKDLGITPNAVYKWLKGRAEPKGRYLMEMLKFSGKLLLATMILTNASTPSEAREAEAQPHPLQVRFIHYTQLRRRIRRWLTTCSAKCRSRGPKFGTG